MLILKSKKKLISILLTGLTLVTGEYCNYWMNNSIDTHSDNDDKDDKSYVIMANDEDINISSYNKLLEKKVFGIYSDYSYNDYYLSDDNVKMEVLSESNIKTGALIRNLDLEGRYLVSDTLFKILDSDGNFITYLKIDNDDIVVNLKPGKYVISQVANNMGYLPNTEEVEFSVLENKIREVKFFNKKSKTGAIIYNIDSDTGENISLLNATIIDANNSTFHFMTNIDPYRVVLAPGFYTLLISDSKGVYGEDEQCYSFYVDDTFSKIIIEHSKQKVKHI